VAPVNPTGEHSLPAIAWTMFRLGLVSFGGNNVLLMSNLMVEQRGWLDQASMDDAIAMATLSPGGNSSNLSYEVGRRLRGVAGGLTAYLAMVLPGILLVVTVGAWILSIEGNPVVAGVLSGAEAAVVAMVTAVGFRLGKKSFKHPLDWALAGVLFVLVGPLNMPLLWCLPPAAAVGYWVRTKGWAK